MPLPPSLNVFFSFPFPYWITVLLFSSQATSDFCVSPDKFIVNQTKDVLTAGVLISPAALQLLAARHHANLSTPPLPTPPPPVSLVSPLRCRALLPVLQPQSAQPLSTGDDEKRKGKNTHAQKKGGEGGGGEDICRTHLRRETHNGERVVLENEFSLVGYRAAGTLSGPLIGSSHNSIASADKP